MEALPALGGIAAKSPCAQKTKPNEIAAKTAATLWAHSARGAGLTLIKKGCLCSWLVSLKSPDI